MNIAHAVGWGLLAFISSPFIFGYIVGYLEGPLSDKTTTGLWILSIPVALAVFLLTL